MCVSRTTGLKNLYFVFQPLQNTLLFSGKYELCGYVWDYQYWKLGRNLIKIVKAIFEKKKTFCDQAPASSPLFESR
jgi:hypothetical protein